MEGSCVLLTDLMNALGFGQNGTEAKDGLDRFDCNFISKYNTQDDDFDYYVERLCGISIPNSSSPRKNNLLWHVYINS